MRWVRLDDHTQKPSQTVWQWALDQLAEGSNPRLKGMGGSQVVQEKALHWMAGKDMRPKEGVRQSWWNPKQHPVSFTLPSFFPDSDLLAYHVHYHMWHLELRWCSLFPKFREWQKDRRTKVFFPLEAHNVGSEMNDFCKETQGRSKHLSIVLFIYTVKYYRHLTKKSVLEFATKLEQKLGKIFLS